MGPRSLNGELHLAASLTFDAGIGDTPEDWYVTYLNTHTDRLVGLAYIVIYGNSTADAQKEPHAMTYDAFETHDGVTLGTDWRFWHWSDTKGFHGTPMGSVTLSNLQFATPAPGAFHAPARPRADELPVR